MKRASLKASPLAAANSPTDLTDRLLDREAERPPAPAKTARTPRATSPNPPPTPAAATRPPAIEPKPAAIVPTAASEAQPPADALGAALAQAQTASLALEAAAQAAPARYSVALRYRLEALAQHVRQVAEFVARLNPQ
ncbi:MAG: hypothetical protein IT317_16520 [Anaerolineales bacterium]|nr:hypothetical protein [Anaerolineales bacterium]